MSELATAFYDEEVLHGDEVPDAAVELAGSKTSSDLIKRLAVLQIALTSF